MAIIFTPGQIVAGPDWEALFAQHGGAKSNQLRAPTKQEQEAADNAGDDLDQNPIYRYYAADGSYVEARRAPNGDYQIVSYQPSQAFQQTQRQQASSDPEAQTPAQQRTAREEAEIAANAALPPDQDPRPETNAQRAERAERNEKERKAAEERRAKEAETATAAAGKRAVRSYSGTDPSTGKPATVTEYADGSKTYEEIKPGAEKPVRSYTGTDPATGKPATVTEYESGRKTYEEIKPGAAERPDRIQDPETKEWLERGPDGVYRPIKVEGTGSTGAGPRLPALIVGQSEAAIRAYHNQLGEEVAAGRMTPAQRANRLQEAFQVANIAMTEAQIAQRALESARSTGFNIASTRLDYFGNGFTNAIKFVNDLNGKLPPGSSLGGDAFVAMLTMQMAIAQRSGIMDLEIPDEALTPEARARRQQQRANLPTPRLTDPTNPTKVAEDRERAIADPIFRPAPPVSAEEASAAVQSAQPEATPAPALPEPIFRPAPPVEAPPAAQAAAPAPSVPAPALAPSAPMPPPPAPLPTAPADMLGDPPPVPANVAPGMMSPSPQDINEWVPPTGVAPMPFNPGPGEPGHRPGDPLGQTPDFPVLANLRVPMPEQQPVPFESPAMLRSIAASTPPWRLPTSMIEQMEAAGIEPELIWSVPRPRVGVGA